MKSALTAAIIAAAGLVTATTQAAAHFGIVYDAAWAQDNQVCRLKSAQSRAKAGDSLPTESISFNFKKLGKRRPSLKGR
jgi:hypothetical protein